MSEKLRTGLSTSTARILEAGGLDTREKVIAAGEVQWLRLPNFGRRRMDEVNAWLGNESPGVRRRIVQSKEFLESLGYSVTPPQ